MRSACELCLCVIHPGIKSLIISFLLAMVTPTIAHSPDPLVLETGTRALSSFTDLVSNANENEPVSFSTVVNPTSANEDLRTIAGDYVRNSLLSSLHNVGTTRLPNQQVVDPHERNRHVCGHHLLLDKSPLRQARRGPHRHKTRAAERTTAASIVSMTLGDGHTSCKTQSCFVFDPKHLTMLTITKCIVKFT